MMPIIWDWRPRWIMSGLQPDLTRWASNQRAVRAWRSANGWTAAKSRLILAMWISPGCSRFRATSTIFLNAQKKLWDCFTPIIIHFAKRPQPAVCGAHLSTAIWPKKAPFLANLPVGKGRTGSQMRAKSVITNILGNAKTGLKTRPVNTAPFAMPWACMTCPPLAKSGSRAAMPRPF